MSGPKTRLPRGEVEQIIGDPKRLDADLQEFRKDTQVLSSRRAKLMQKYPKRWVAIYRGEVQADARSLNEILKAIDQLGLPRESVVVQYVDQNVRTMIL